MKTQNKSNAVKIEHSINILVLSMKYFQRLQSVSKERIDQNVISTCMHLKYVQLQAAMHLRVGVYFIADYIIVVRKTN